jgi:NAD(P)-dependent dehydrogenase (short-subunit alcohol dehydrogenase family)
MPSVLITGTSSGLGLGVATRLHDLGWDVLGTVLDRADEDRVPWATVVCDVTDDDSVAALGLVVDQRFGGRLDALVNNAGIAMAGPWEELAPAELRLSLGVNLVGAMAVTGACLPALREAKGVIVNISSVSGQAGDPLMGPYNASKFGLEGASEALRLELRPFGVRVHLVEPGPFRTPISAASPIAAAKDPDGVYAEHWKVIEDWLSWHAESSADPAQCIAAIVGAVTRDDAPFRIPVGDGISDVVRKHAAAVTKQADAADAWLATL